MPRHPDVSDHALVRYLERVRGVDLARIRRRIAKAAAPAVQHGAERVTVDGVTFIVSGEVVVTVHETRGRKLRRRRRIRKVLK